jgi:hypothetical protein
MARRESEWQRRSPVQFGYTVVSFIATVAGVIAWASHAHHPGSVWYLVGALLIFAAWAGTEALRFRREIERRFSSVRHRLVFDTLVCENRATPPSVHLGIRLHNKATEPVHLEVLKMVVTLDGNGQTNPRGCPDRCGTWVTAPSSWAMRPPPSRECSDRV